MGSALVQSKVDTKDASKLVEALNMVVDAAALSLRDKQRLMALAQGAAAESAAAASGDDLADGELGAPEPELYKTHSEGIVDVLEDLREKAEAQLSEARKQEVNAKHAFELLKQSLSDQVAAQKKEMGALKASTATAGMAKATAAGDLAVTQKTLADSEAALETVRGDCMSRAADHEASKKGLAEELAALAAAKKAVAVMTTAAEGATYSMLLQVDIRGHRRAAAGQ